MEFSDLITFVDREARIATNPVFGKIFDSTKSTPGSPPSGNKTAKPKGISLLAQVHGSKRPPTDQSPRANGGQSSRPREEQSDASREQSSSVSGGQSSRPHEEKGDAHGKERSCARGGQGSHTQVKQSSSTDPVPPSGNPQCLYCSRNHALEDCQAPRWKPYPERIQFLESHMLCFGCLSNDHVSRFCPQRMTCKIANCTRKHPSILHTNFRERPTTDVGVGTESRSDTQVRSNMVNAGTNVDHADQSMDERCRTSMAILPVKVRARNGDKTVITYAFLDNGSSATFCTESLMEQLGAKGPKVKISLSTLEKKKCCR